MVISQDMARNLAVCYNAYCAALTAQDNEGIELWAWMLQRAQAETGVMLINECNLEGTLAAAKSRRASAA